MGSVSKEASTLAEEVARIITAKSYDATLYESLVGQNVIIRDNMSGVFCGPLLSVSHAGVVMGPGTRQLHYWEKGGSVAQIAAAGIGGEKSRVTAPCEEGVGWGFQAPNIVSVMALSAIAWQRISNMAVWKGGM